MDRNDPRHPGLAWVLANTTPRPTPEGFVDCRNPECAEWSKGWHSHFHAIA